MSNVTDFVPVAASIDSTVGFLVVLERSFMMSFVPRSLESSPMSMPFVFFSVDAVVSLLGEGDARPPVPGLFLEVVLRELNKFASRLSTSSCVGELGLNSAPEPSVCKQTF